MKTCPFCAEEIQDAAIVCKHCKRDLVAVPSPTVIAAPPAVSAADSIRTQALPFLPIPGATPTSGGLFFLVAVVIVLLSLLLGPVGVPILVLGTSVWAAFDASKHKLAHYQSGLGGPVGACLGSLLLWIVVFPWYLAIRSRIRAGVQPVKN